MKPNCFSRQTPDQDASWTRHGKKRKTKTYLVDYLDIASDCPLIGCFRDYPSHIFRHVLSKLC